MSAIAAERGDAECRLLEMRAGQLMRCRNEQFRRFHFKHFADDGLQVVLVHDDAPLLGENEKRGQYCKQANKHERRNECQRSQGNDGE